MDGSPRMPSLKETNEREEDPEILLHGIKVHRNLIMDDRHGMQRTLEILSIQPLPAITLIDWDSVE
jgi:hypothetical protein